MTFTLITLIYHTPIILPLIPCKNQNATIHPNPANDVFYEEKIDHKGCHCI